MLNDSSKLEKEHNGPLYKSFSPPAKNNGKKADFTLMTFTEKTILTKAEKYKKGLIKKRATELGFFPQDLTDRERIAVYMCLSTKEWQRILSEDAVLEKNFRLQKLSDDEKLAIRKFCCLSHLMAGVEFLCRGPIMSEVKRMRKKDREELAFSYSLIMDEYHEKIYEKLYFSSRCKQDQFGAIVQEQVSVEELCRRISKREWWEPE